MGFGGKSLVVGNRGDLPSGVLCQSAVVIIGLPGFRVEDDIFEDGAEFDGVEDIGFLVGGETYALRIALEQPVSLFRRRNVRFFDILLLRC